ncbi:hypothetical protein SAMN02745866_00959 [Alteromonadaceae bacterium Bs31]|nr:hypothetical protein SAMN02745866_00959 [Alteromonadaceae bacterium Bs31]
MLKSSPKTQWQNNWQTEAGAWFPGERVIMHGENILQSMEGKQWMDIILFAIRGEHGKEDSNQLLDKVLTFSGCIPDPRLWNNRIAALAGSARSSSTLGISGATAVSDAIIYGFQPTHRAYTMLRDLQSGLQKDSELSELVKARMAQRRDKKRGKPGKGKKREVDIMPGYGRPVSTGDERMRPLMKLLKREGADSGAAVQLAFRVEACLQELGYPLKLNMGGLIAAIGLDQQLKEREFVYYLTQCFCPGFIVCYEDALKHPAGSFFPMRCSQIKYKGHSSRQWQKADD